MPKLLTPVNDGEIARLLRERYGFQTELRINADRSQVLTALVNYRKTLRESSNLLIYFAGHGHYDSETADVSNTPVSAANMDDTGSRHFSKPAPSSSDCSKLHPNESVKETSP